MKDEKTEKIERKAQSILMRWLCVFLFLGKDEIIIGDKWVLDRKPNPFKKTNHTVEIIGYKEKYVNYSMGGLFTNEVLKENMFRRCYKKQKDI